MDLLVFEDIRHLWVIALQLGRPPSRADSSLPPITIEQFDLAKDVVPRRTRHKDRRKR
jgi:hypothetical protein